MCVAGAEDIARLGYQQWLARHFASAPNPALFQAMLQQAAVAPGMSMLAAQQQQSAAAAAARNAGAAGNAQLPPPQQGAMQVCATSAVALGAYCRWQEDLRKTWGMLGKPCTGCACAGLPWHDCPSPLAPPSSSSSSRWS